MTDLDIARDLARAGVPIFLAQPDPTRDLRFRLPPRWQLTEPDPSVLDRWEPGMAVCAVTGVIVDALDRDPRHGGEMEEELIPQSYGHARTPSGGTHDLIAPLGVHSRDGVLPGVDVKAGDGQEGRGFIFIAPTVKQSREDGEDHPYVWEDEPDLSMLLLGNDQTGEPLARLIGKAEEIAGKPYDGPAYDSLSPVRQQASDEKMNLTIDGWHRKFKEAAEWGEGERDDSGRGWEKLASVSAYWIADLGLAPWCRLTLEDAETEYLRILPDVIADAQGCGGKFRDKVRDLSKPGAQHALPPWEDPLWEGIPFDEQPMLPRTLDDSTVAEWLARSGMKGQWKWSLGLGWLGWDGKRWKPRSDATIREVVRSEFKDLVRQEILEGATGDRVSKLNRLLNNSKISAVVTVMRGIVEVEASDFDTHYDLLNVGNGVVDLRTGALRKHDPDLLFTKVTDTPYEVGASHPDWDTVLTALDEESMRWMQIRLGQGMTGWPTSDDILPIGYGGGSNGKSTLLDGLYAALGDLITQVPEKLIRANPSDHPTELMTLRGARLALIDETPEAADLNVQRIKATVGQSRMIARAIRKDNVEWIATHSMFVFTNYKPRVRETDHGTWRRLALVIFDRKFPRDDTFKSRIRSGTDGRREAVLAWIVEGAREWYRRGRSIPDAPSKVAEDTLSWRGDSDTMMAFIGPAGV